MCLGLELRAGLSVLASTRLTQRVGLGAVAYLEGMAARHPSDQGWARRCCHWLLGPIFAQLRSVRSPLSRLEGLNLLTRLRTAGLAT